MPDLRHLVSIEATPEDVYSALTTQEGLRGWWTADTEAEPRIGSVAVFGFDQRQAVFRMRIDALERTQLVRWYCLGDHHEWKDTQLTWQISADGDSTTVELVHAGWKSETPFMASCNSMWGHLMFRLKDFSEGKGNDPQWTE